AQTPSGIPVTITAPVSDRPKRSTNSARGRRSTGSATRRAPARQPFDAAA
ncbi:ATP-dependent helicase, partial [Streptomyces sp. NPDC003038]